VIVVRTSTASVWNPAVSTAPTPDCLCEPVQVVPQGNLVALRDVGTDGKGSTLTRTVTVKLQAREARPGSCPAGTSSPTTLDLSIVDDDGDPVAVGNGKNGYCEAGKNTHMKFWVRYVGPENCKDSAVPTQQVSRGDLFITATASGGALDDKLGIQCKK
jgi:hypothetical protein